MGPLISAGQRETVASFLDGEQVAIRGSAPDGPGFWFAPTVLHPVDPPRARSPRRSSARSRACIPFDGEAEAIRLANDTIYGLSGSIWTRDGAKALRVARALETGNLSINSNSSVRVTTPFGGFKQSGYGRELGPHALDAYTEVKTVYSRTQEGLVMAGRLEGKVCVVTGRQRRHRRGDGRGASSARARRSPASTCSRARPATCR